MKNLADEKIVFSRRRARPGAENPACSEAVSGISERSSEVFPDHSLRRSVLRILPTAAEGGPLRSRSRSVSRRDLCGGLGAKGLVESFREVNYASAVFGISIIGIELGYLLIYRLGGRVS